MKAKCLVALFKGVVRIEGAGDVGITVEIPEKDRPNQMWQVDMHKSSVCSWKDIN